MNEILECGLYKKKYTYMSMFMCILYLLVYKIEIPSACANKLKKKVVHASIWKKYNHS